MEISLRYKILLSPILLLAFLAACGTPSGATPTQTAHGTPSVAPATLVSPITETGVPARDPSVRKLPSVQTYLSHASDGVINVTYCVMDGIDLKLDIYFPKTTSGATPLAVFIHGGGWNKGDKGDGQGQFEIPALLEAGFTVTSLNYRLAPDYPFPAMIEDVKCAIRSLRAHAAEFHIDPKRIGVFGDSAGAHLANLIGVTGPEAGFDNGEYLDQSSRVRAVVDLFGPADLTVDFSKSFADLREPVLGDFDPLKASPVNYATPDDPPFLILQGDADRTVPLSQSELFYKALQAGGVEATLVVVKNGDHGFQAPGITPTRPEITQMIVDFFVEHVN